MTVPTRRVRRLGMLVALAAVGLGGQAPADPADLAFPFAVATGTTLVWRDSESETASLGGEHREAVRWSVTLTLVVGAALADGFEARLTVGNVAPETGNPDTLHYVLARAVSDRPLDVILDKGGFVREVHDWPAVREAMQAALPALTDATSAGVIATTLGGLDATQAGAVVARPLLLLSAAYGITYKSDGTASLFPDWRGGSAYIFPGRRLAARIVGRQDTQVFAQWSLTTDPMVAGEHVGSELLAVLNGAAKGASTLAESARSDSAMIATSGIDLGEQGAFAFDAARHRVTQFKHRVTVSVGDFQRVQELQLDLAP